jgi:hypothetical protein
MIGDFVWAGFGYLGEASAGEDPCGATPGREPTGPT